MARYASDTLDRILAIRVMRDVMGMAMPEIRRELLTATPDRIGTYARRAERLLNERPPQPTSTSSSEAPTALDYISQLRRTTTARPRKDAAKEPELASTRPTSSAERRGFEALEDQLAYERHSPAPRARAEEWLRIPVTPDVELCVRAPLEPTQRARLERCADLMRDILNGRDR